MKRLLAGVILALALAAPVSAAGVTPSIAVNEPSPIMGGPVMGGQVTFTIVIDKNKDCTGKSQCGLVNIACSQDVTGVSTIVWYAGPVSISEARNPGFTLGLGIGGPATCTAEVDNYHFGTVYATTTFTAAG